MSAIRIACCSWTARTQRRWRHSDPKIEAHSLFPARINAEFVTVSRIAHICACGCGSAALASPAPAAPAPVRPPSPRIGAALTDRKVEVLLDGGALTIEWRESDGHILMTGPAMLSFKGDIDLGAYAS